MATEVAAPLPDLTLLPGTTITVDAGAAGATVTALVLHGFQVIPEDDQAAPPRLRPPAPSGGV